jgi:hypothetical protein
VHDKAFFDALVAARQNWEKEIRAVEKLFLMEDSDTSDGQADRVE